MNGDDSRELITCRVGDTTHARLVTSRCARWVLGCTPFDAIARSAAARFRETPCADTFLSLRRYLGALSVPCRRARSAVSFRGGLVFPYSCDSGNRTRSERRRPDFVYVANFQPSELMKLLRLLRLITQCASGPQHSLRPVHADVFRHALTSSAFARARLWRIRGQNDDLYGHPLWRNELAPFGAT